MPRYKNIGQGNASVELMSGALKTLKPGEEEDTRRFYDDPDLQKLSDTPLWESMAMEPTDINLASLAGTPYESTIDGFTGAVVPVPADAWHIYIVQISGTITVRRQAPDGPVEMLNRYDAYPYFRIEAAGTMTKLLVSGSGTFQIKMYRRPITDN